MAMNVKPIPTLDGRINEIRELTARIVNRDILPHERVLAARWRMDATEAETTAAKARAAAIKETVKKALEKADFKSVRGGFKFGNNHMPIQNFYLQDVVKDAKGDFVLKTVATIVKNNQDAFHTKCPMK